jgi:hypothetical protein
VLGGLEPHQRRRGPRVRARLTLALAAAAAAAALAAAAPPAGAVVLKGISAAPLYTGIEDVAPEFDAAAAGNVDLIRIPLDWSLLERWGAGAPDSAYLERADALFALARRRGIGVVATLFGTPCWASSAPSLPQPPAAATLGVPSDSSALATGCAGGAEPPERAVPWYPPVVAGDYAAAAAFAARRWAPVLRAIEVWNEPNFPFFWRAPDDVADYAALVRATAPAVHRAAPAVQVLAGSLAGADARFLAALYDRGGIGGSFDGISVHPYTGAGDPRQPQRTYLRDVPAVHALMTAHGDGGRPVWVTEMGFATCPGGVPRGCVTERQQADYIAATYEIPRARWPWLAAVIVYTLRDDPLRRGREAYFGLLRPGGEPKPAWAVFRLVARGAGSP